LKQENQGIQCNSIKIAPIVNSVVFSKGYLVVKVISW